MIDNTMKKALFAYRSARVLLRKLKKTEPFVSTTYKTNLEQHGNEGYGSWAIPKKILNSNSTIVDVGLGEDISFSESLIASYGCLVHGFDPTPKSISYIERRQPKNFRFYPLGLAGSSRKATFFLPNNPDHISGAIINTSHVGANQIEVDLVDLQDVLKKINRKEIDLLKIDIEGAEYEVFESEVFKKNAQNIHILCVEMHHRWQEYGPQATLSAVNLLNKLGFECVWQSRESNEEFTFINTRWAAQMHSTDKKDI